MGEWVDFEDQFNLIFTSSMSTKENTNRNRNKKNPNPQGRKFNFNILFIVVVAVLLGFNLFGHYTPDTRSVSELVFRTEMLQKGDVERIQPILNKGVVRVFIKRDSLQKPLYKRELGKQWEVLARTSNHPQFSFKVSNVRDYAKEVREIFKAHPELQEIPIEPKEESEWFSTLFTTYLLPAVFFVLIWILLMRKLGGGIGGGGGRIFSIGKSKAQLFDKDNAKMNVTFSNVAGLDEAKAEVVEIVDYLKNPKKYTALGARIPKGALLVGPPGTGKTLIAKAMAGEAKVPFFSLSGSDFVEMFVGVGASRVRDLFKQAREKAPCVIFIDEIDAIGRARGKNVIVSNDERENTLNQLLVEMDGFGTDTGIIVVAATNRPDVLDSALLRPGRFDRQIAIDRPDIKGREAIFAVHIKNIKGSKDLDLHRLAEQTPGFVGADIANVCNEAALFAARKDKKEIEMEDFQDAIDRVIGGLEKKNKIISPEEKKIIAYHEAGHAVCGWFLEHAYPLLKVTIVPRGTAVLGYAQYTPKEQYLYSTEQLFDQVCMALGGRVAEEIFFGTISTGASNDLQQVTRTCYSMVAVYGMSERLGNMNYYDPAQDNSFVKPYSEETSKLIDEEVRKFVAMAYERTLKLLKNYKKEVNALAQALLEKEVLFQSDVEKLIGARVFEKSYQIRFKSTRKEAVKEFAKETKSTRKTVRKTTLLTDNSGSE